MDITRSDELLLALSVVLQLLLCVVLFRSRLYRIFPIFFLCIFYSGATDAAFLPASRHMSEWTYFFVYFAQNLLQFLLELGIIVEVGFNVLNPVKRSLPRVAIYLFLGMIVVATALAVVLSMHAAPAQLSRWPQYYLRMNLTVAFLRLTIFGAVAVFSHFLGIGWKNHVLQIATGFLGYAIVFLFVEMLHHYSGAIATNPARYHLLDQIRILGWCTVLGYWSYTLSRKEAPRKEFSPQMAKFLVSISQASRTNLTTAEKTYRK
jgi:hypothetical protein